MIGPNDQPSHARQLSRRRVTTALAWSVPVITVAAAAPAFAVSAVRFTVNWTTLAGGLVNAYSPDNRMVQLSVTDAAYGRFAISGVASNTSVSGSNLVLTSTISNGSPATGYFRPNRDYRQLSLTFPDTATNISLGVPNLVAGGYMASGIQLQADGAAQTPTATNLTRDTQTYEGSTPALPQAYYRTSTAGSGGTASYTIASATTLRLTMFDGYIAWTASAPANYSVTLAPISFTMNV